MPVYGGWYQHGLRSLSLSQTSTMRSFAVLAMLASAATGFSAWPHPPRAPRRGSAHTATVNLDYAGCRSSDAVLSARALLSAMREVAGGAPYGHSEPRSSPPGFFAVCAAGGNHITAHCDLEAGLLALDVFAYGDADAADAMADALHGRVQDLWPDTERSERIAVDRFGGGGGGGGAKGSAEALIDRAADAYPERPHETDEAMGDAEAEEARRIFGVA